jgi:S-adenosylmethionine decarboxylase
MMRGYHLIIDAFKCKKEKLGNFVFIKEFLINLTKQIDMEILSGPYLSKAKEGEPDGITGVVVITTSHISIHTFTDTNHFWMDIFSCREFDKDKVIKIIEKEFGVKPRTRFLLR